MVWAGAEHSPCTLQAEVWDLDMLRSNHSTWPVRVSQIKQGFIVVKGHSTVSLQLIASLPSFLCLCPSSLPQTHSCTGSFTGTLPMGTLNTKGPLPIECTPNLLRPGGLVLCTAPI